jgi:hypothetical protein
MFKLESYNSSIEEIYWLHKALVTASENGLNSPNDRIIYEYQNAQGKTTRLICTRESLERLLNTTENCVRLYKENSKSNFIEKANKLSKSEKNRRLLIKKNN